MTSRASDSDVYLNTATVDELDEVLALRGHEYEIVRYREGRGRIASRGVRREPTLMLRREADVRLAVDDIFF